MNNIEGKIRGERALDASRFLVVVLEGFR